MIQLKSLLLACCSVLLLAGSADAQLFGQMGPPGGMGQGRRLLGAYMTGGSGDMEFSAELRGNSGSRSTVGLAASTIHSTFGMQADLRGPLDPAVTHMRGRNP
ncbi:MAG: hypothetical protein HZB25_14030 [Candidatus Eisenbacteria bacterium]|nr:hypothetical protein [Candidatus Eisenbacteria bacterium]